MARVIGDLTPADAPDTAEEITFGYFGADIRVHPEFGELVFNDWASEFGDLKPDDPKALQATKVLMRELVHPDDFDAFWTLARRHKQSSEDLSKVFAAVLEAMADRPTGRPFSSSPGPTSTAPSYAAASSLRVMDRLEAEGRPDLALVVARAQEALTG